jgi:hypothetical protein
MGMKDPRIGYNSVTEFMGSGLPWVTSSIATGGTTLNYKFSKITKRLSVWNHETSTSKHIRVGFTKNGVEKGNYLLIDSGQTFEFDARIKEIFIRADDPADNPPFSVYAELIAIDADMMPQLTGSVGGITFWEGVG